MNQDFVLFITTDHFIAVGVIHVAITTAQWHDSEIILTFAFHWSNLGVN